MSYKKISSRHNEWFKQLVLLGTERKARQESGLFLIEGRRFVEAALQAHAPLTHLLFAEELADTPELSPIIAGCPSEVAIHSVSKQLITKVARTQHPQGILATVRMRSWDLPSLLGETRRHLWLVMDGLADPGNMGTMIRTADAAGFDGVIIGPACVDLYNPKTLRATMGSIFHLPCLTILHLDDALAELRQAGIRLIASHLKATDTPYSIDLSQRAAIIVGNEAHGISAQTQLSADTLVKIPMLGRAESLNACTAANILLYESVRQRL